jgi:hypothetical protein
MLGKICRRDSTVENEVIEYFNAEFYSRSTLHVQALLNMFRVTDRKTLLLNLDEN